MQALPTNWKEIWGGIHRKENKVTISGVEYNEKETIALSTSSALFAKGTASIGGCVAKQIDILVKPKGDIPRMAEIRVFVRLVTDDMQSDWLPKGVFFIDTRRRDAVTGILTIHGYDAMLKSEDDYLQEGDTGEWPRRADVVVSEIAARMGVELDNRTVIDPSVLVPYPNDWTMREVLGYIAVAHCGNWIITDTGKLRLVPFGMLPEETNYLVDERGNAITFGGVRIIV